MVTTSKSGYRPHSIEYRRIQQVDVPDTYTLRELVAVWKMTLVCPCLTLLRGGKGPCSAQRKVRAQA